MVKPWYESKMLWVNVVTTIALTVEILTQGQLIPAVALPYVAAGVAILNVILRVWFTNQSLVK